MSFLNYLRSPRRSTLPDRIPYHSMPVAQAFLPVISGDGLAICSGVRQLRFFVEVDLLQRKEVFAT
jgi:hypothetical protein